uniref:Uncharacterized protein n=1 Tax=Anguilla anguilla TaxID=7936 RepID=A0A0E9TPK0_ANGAN
MLTTQRVTLIHNSVYM